MPVRKGRLWTDACTGDRGGAGIRSGSPLEGGRQLPQSEGEEGGPGSHADGGAPEQGER